MSGLHVAVVGATGLVGEKILQVLHERNFPVGRLKLLASARSAGCRLAYNGESLPVEETTEAAFKGVDLALFASSEAGAETFGWKAVAQGAVVVDNSSTFRLDERVPLVVPEVNAHALGGHQGLIANPNCSTIQLVMALKPILDHAGLEEVIVATYQSVSGWGKAAVAQLEREIQGYAKGEETPLDKAIFPHPIAFNAIPHIDRFMDDGATKEEWKMIRETKKILEHDVPVLPTCVRLPTFVGHAEAVWVKTKEPAPIEAVRAWLEAMPGVVVVDDPARYAYPTPRSAVNRDEVFVGRLRKDPATGRIGMFVVADNLRKGAATNAVQIAERLFVTQRAG